MSESRPGPEPKSTEILQAQAAAFAADRLTHRRDSEHVLDHVAELAASNDTDVRRVTEGREYVRAPDGEHNTIQPGTEVQVVKPTEYTQYLREVGGSKYEPIAVRAELLRAYSEFEEEVDKLLDDVQQSDELSSHENFLGAGSNASAFKLEHDGRAYVVRIANTSHNESASMTDQRLAPHIYAKGIPHLEQIVAVSYEKGITVSELIPGQNLGEVSAEDLSHVSDEQLNDLIDTVMAAGAAGVAIDPKPSNFMYDPKEGFGIVDLLPIKADQQQASLETLKTLPGVLANVGVYGKHLRSSPETSADYRYRHEQAKAALTVMEQFKAICDQRFEGDMRTEILEQANSRIDSTRDTINRYGDPRWVAAEVAHKAEEKRVWAERKARAAVESASTDDDDFIF